MSFFMARLLPLALIFIAFSTQPSFAREPWRADYDSISEYSSEPYHMGRTYRVSVKDLRPTQFAVGMGEVRKRAADIAEMGKHELREYLKEKVGTVVIGPGEEFYLVDGHHVATALYKTGASDEMLVKVTHDWSKLSQKEFFARMIRQKLLWPYDENGRPKDPGDLPHSIGQLKDDVYRTLAYKVRKAGGYKDLTVPFQEFLWANYFRKLIPIEKVRRSPEAALSQAMELSRQPEARKLPGFKRSTARCTEILTRR